MKLKISMFQLKLVLSTSHRVRTVRTAVCNVRGHRQRITRCRYGWSQGNSVIVTFAWFPSLIWWCVCRGSVQCLSAVKLHPPPPAHCPLCRPLLPPTLALSSHQLRCPVSRVTTDHPAHVPTCPHMSPCCMLHAAVSPRTRGVCSGPAVQGTLPPAARPARPARDGQYPPQPGVDTQPGVHQCSSSGFCCCCGVVAAVECC